MEYNPCDPKHSVENWQVHAWGVGDFLLCWICFFVGRMPSGAVPFVIVHRIVYRREILTTIPWSWDTRNNNEVAMLSKPPKNRNSWPLSLVYYIVIVKISKEEILWSYSGHNGCYQQMLMPIIIRNFSSPLSAKHLPSHKFISIHILSQGFVYSDESEIYSIYSTYRGRANHWSFCTCKLTTQVIPSSVINLLHRRGSETVKYFDFCCSPNRFLKLPRRMCL